MGIDVLHASRVYSCEGTLAPLVESNRLVPCLPFNSHGFSDYTVPSCALGAPDRSDRDPSWSLTYRAVWRGGYVDRDGGVRCRQQGSGRTRTGRERDYYTPFCTQTSLSSQTSRGSRTPVRAAPSPSHASFCSSRSRASRDGRLPCRPPCRLPCIDSPVVDVLQRAS